MTELAGRRVLLTGAGGGFGRELVSALLAAGAEVVAADRDEHALEPAHAAAAAAGTALAGHCCADLRAAAGCEALYDYCRQRELLPDVLINNAGVGLYGRHDEVPVEDWEALLALNLLAPMRLSARFVPHMIDRQAGHIVNVSSMAGWVASRGMCAYSAAKFGLRGFSDALRDELGSCGIGVTAVYPFFSRTAIIDSRQYGSLPRLRPPDAIMSDPATVVAAMIDGLRHDRREVFPDPWAKRMQFLQRHTPWLLRLLAGRMERRFLVD